MGYVALSELKSALGISGSTEDDFLNLAINSATTSIDDLCGRVFTTDTSATARIYRAQPYYTVVDDIHTTTDLVIKTDTSGDGTYDTTWASTDYQMTCVEGFLLLTRRQRREYTGRNPTTRW